MARTRRWFMAAAALLIGILIHAFYVNYELDAAGYLISWPATASQRESEVDRMARTKVRPPTQQRVFRPGTGVTQMRDHIEKYCTPTDEYTRRRREDRLFWDWDPTNTDYWRCSEHFVEQKEEWVTVATPGIDYDSARAQVEKEFELPMRFGMVPSQIVAGNKPTRNSFVKSFWLGIIVPVALTLFAIFLGITAARPLRSDIYDESSSRDSLVATHREPETVKGERSQVAEGSPKSSLERKGTLGELLRSQLGEDFPVGEGDATESSPLVITAKRDYVSVEYAVVRQLLPSANKQVKLCDQALLNRNGRKIDKLVFDIRTNGETDRQVQKSFYFDITDGFGVIG